MVFTFLNHEANSVKPLCKKTRMGGNFKCCYHEVNDFLPKLMLNTQLPISKIIDYFKKFTTGLETFRKKYFQELSRALKFL